MPARDEHGQLRVTYEFRPATTVFDRERFDDLARLLYRRWVLDPESGDNFRATATNAAVDATLRSLTAAIPQLTK